MDHNIPRVGSPWALDMPQAQGECLVAMHPQHTHRQAGEGNRDGADPSDRIAGDTKGGGQMSGTLDTCLGEVMSSKQEMYRAGALGWPWRPGL